MKKEIYFSINSIGRKFAFPMMSGRALAISQSIARLFYTLANLFRQ